MTTTQLRMATPHAHTQSRVYLKALAPLTAAILGLILGAWTSQEIPINHDLHLGVIETQTQQLLIKNSKLESLLLESPFVSSEFASQTLQNPQIHLYKCEGGDVNYPLPRLLNSGPFPPIPNPCKSPVISSEEFYHLLDLRFSSNCTKPRVPWSEFACLAGCAKQEPELEYSVRLMRMAEHGAIEHVVSSCLRKIVPAMIWFEASTRTLRLFRCASNLPEPELQGILRLLIAALCLVELPPPFNSKDFVLGVDPQDYATPTFSAPTQRLLNYIHPLPGVARFVGTKTHPSLLLPTGSHVVATAHCSFRNSRKWWVLCTAHNAKRDSLSFSQRNRTLMWRGLPTGVPWSELQWRFHQRARLVREFRDKPGFDVGYMRNLKRVAKTSPELFEEMSREWAKKGQIPKENHPDWAYLLHVDGNTASWGLSHKLNSGSVLVWIESNHDYREHFYLLLEPWVHYVPVAVDMSDLESVRNWLWANPEKAEKIARNAAKLADERLRAQDLYCYLTRLLGSVLASQTREPLANKENLIKYMGDEAVHKAEYVWLETD